MKVYIVESGSYDGSRVEGVFRSREVAISFMDKRRTEMEADEEDQTGVSWEVMEKPAQYPGDYAYTSWWSDILVEGLFLSEWRVL